MMHPARARATALGLGLSLVLGLGLAAAPLSAADTAQALFAAEATPTGHAAHPIGQNARGCLAGAVELPESGPTWQAMRLSRNHHWGHPETVAFIERFSAEARQVGWAGLYIGDISQPRGGPVKGHASHQTGLDVDIWLSPALRLDLSPAERERLSAIDVRTADQRGLNRNWTAAHAFLLETAARDPQVERIFITPPAKLALCRTAGPGDTAWLRKVRPWWGHNDHMHVRLHCPPGDRACVDPDPVPPGNGCQDAVWWVTAALEPPDPNAPKPKPKPPLRLADLPGQCRDVLQAR